MHVCAQRTILFKMCVHRGALYIPRRIFLCLCTFVHICAHSTTYLRVHGYIVCARVSTPVSLVYVCKVRVAGKIPWSEEEGERGSPSGIIRRDPGETLERPSWNPKGLEKARQGEPVASLAGASLHRGSPQLSGSPTLFPGLGCCCAYGKLIHTSTAHTQIHKHFNTYAFYRGHAPSPWMDRSCLGIDWVPGTQ